MAKISLNELRTRAPTIDRAKLDATTDAQIEAYKAEEGHADLPVPDNVAKSPRGFGERSGPTRKEILSLTNSEEKILVASASMADQFLVLILMKRNPTVSSWVPVSARLASSSTTAWSSRQGRIGSWATGQKPGVISSKRI